MLPLPPPVVEGIIELADEVNFKSPTEVERYFKIVDKIMKSEVRKNPPPTKQETKQFLRKMWRHDLISNPEVRRNPSLPAFDEGWIQSFSKMVDSLDLRNEVAVDVVMNEGDRIISAMMEKIIHEFKPEHAATMPTVLRELVAVYENNGNPISYAKMFQTISSRYANALMGDADTNEIVNYFASIEFIAEKGKSWPEQLTIAIRKISEAKIIKVALAREKVTEPPEDKFKIAFLNYLKIVEEQENERYGEEQKKRGFTTWEKRKVIYEDAHHPSYYKVMIVTPESLGTESRVIHRYVNKITGEIHFDSAHPYTKKSFYLGRIEGKIFDYANLYKAIHGKDMPPVKEPIKEVSNMNWGVKEKVPGRSYYGISHFKELYNEMVKNKDKLRFIYANADPNLIDNTPYVLVGEHDGKYSLIEYNDLTRTFVKWAHENLETGQDTARVKIFEMDKMIADESHRKVYSRSKFDREFIDKGNQTIISQYEIDNLKAVAGSTAAHHTEDSDRRGNLDPPPPPTAQEPPKTTGVRESKLIRGRTVKWFDTTTRRELLGEVIESDESGVKIKSFTDGTIRHIGHELLPEVKSTPTVIDVLQKAKEQEILEGVRESNLPEGWTVEDIDFLLEKVIRGNMIHLTDKKIGLPTIHQIPSEGVRHIGMGYFEGETSNYTIQFEGGGAMNKTPEGNPFTVLTIKKGKYPYDFEKAIKNLRAWLPESQS